MSGARQVEPGLYGALGVAPTATARQIELAFRAWGERLGSGRASLAAYRRAETAYYVLSAEDARARHDRQLGLVRHPAFGEPGERSSGEMTRRAIRELERGRAARARSMLERAVAHSPADPLARSYLAVALARSGGDLHEAARHGRHALGRRPGNAAFLFNLAEVYAAAGFRARALATRARAWQALAASLLGFRKV